MNKALTELELPTSKEIRIKRREGRPGDRQLRKRAQRQKMKADLPLSHVTNVWSANEIVQDGKINTTHCHVFGEDLLYFFVLRPAYRGKDWGDKSHQLNRFPVAFFFRSDAVEWPRHVYPFDTGGAVAGAFSAKADPNIPLDDYELDPTHHSAAGHIEWAYGSIASYFDGTLRPDILQDIPEFETVTRGFIDIARMGREGSNQHDRRASTVELASSHDIDLQYKCVFAILPKQYLDTGMGSNSAFLEELIRLGVKFDTYEWRPNTKPDEYQSRLMRIARNWLSSEGWT